MSDEATPFPMRLGAVRPEVKAAAETAPQRADAVIKVELDERAYLFPRPKQLTHLQVSVYKPTRAEVSAIFAYNTSGQPTQLFDLNAEDITDFTQQVVGSVYRAQSGMIVTKSISIGISVVANGYIWQFGDLTSPQELYLSTGGIWRVCGAFGRACDLLTLPARH
jgi:hypothetical protein